MYQFKERIHIGEVEFKGNDNMKTEDLEELALVKEYSFLNFNELQQTLSAIKEKYKEKGYYLVEVSYKTKAIPKEEKLKLIIDIKENDKLLIKRINFVGNRNIPSKNLKAYLLTKEKNLLSFLGSSGIFQPKFIDRDLQFIEYYYRDKGYLNVRVYQPEITITPDRKFLYITFSISEGPKFKMGQVAFQGDDIVSSETVMDQLSLKKEEYFSLSRLQKDIQLISLLYKDKGYAFAEAKPLFYPDPVEEDKIHILFKVNPGEIYKLRRIRLFGNKNARDKVLFRRFQIKEGDHYNESRKELSRQLIQQLGYFEEVDIKPVPSDTSKGELDLLVRVKERESTGEAFLSGGYNSETKLFIQGGVKKQNFLGLDQSISLNLTFSKHNEMFIFNYQNPYLWDSHWRFSFDIFNVTQNTLSGSGSFSSPFSSQDYFSYFQLNTGFSISLGRHLTEFSTVSLKYRLQKQSLSHESIYFLRTLPVISPVFQFLFGKEDDKIKTQAQLKEKPDEHKQAKIQSLDEVKEEGEEGDSEKANEQTENQQENIVLQKVTFDDIYDLEKGTGFNSSLFVIWEYDKRNDRYYASEGFFTRLSAEYSGLGGDFDYTKFQGKFHHYYSPFWKLVIKNRLDYGWIFSNTKGEEPLFTELFFLGGPYNLRGFPVNSQAPRRPSPSAFNYAQRYNSEIDRAKVELPEKRVQLSKLELKDSPNNKTDNEIKKIKAEIARNEKNGFNGAIKISKSFCQKALWRLSNVFLQFGAGNSLD